MSLQQHNASDLKQHSSINAHPHSATLDPELEARINRIMMNIPEHIKQSTLENPLKKSQPTVLSDKSKPSSERASRGLDDSQQAQEASILSGLQEGNTRVHKTVYQEHLNKKIDEAIHRTRKLVDGASQSPNIKVQPLRDAGPGLNFDSINQQVEKAIQRTELNLKLSGEYKVPIYASPSHQSNAQPFFSTAERTKHPHVFASPNNIETRLFASEQKAFPAPSGFEYAKKEYPVTAVKKPLTFSNIDAIFNEAMQRSHEVLKRNEELSKSANSKLLAQTEFYSKIGLDTIKTSHFALPRSALDDINSKLSTEKAETITTPVFPKEEPKFDISKFQVGGPENKLSGTHFNGAGHGGESKYKYTSFASPTKLNKELHIFNNAVVNLSPSQKTKTVEEDYQNGSAYKGEKVEGKKQGRGLFTYEDGSKYEGDWEDDVRCGFGSLTTKIGEIEYEGEWVNDKFHGNGNLHNTSPKELDEAFDYQDFGKLEGSWVKYEGEFVNGKWEGLGKLYLSNKEKYIGKFRNGEIDGAGTFYQRTGETVTGEWKHNKFVGAL